MKTKSNRTKVYYRRIPDDKELVKLMDGAIIEAARSSFKVAEWLKREYGVVYGDTIPDDSKAIAKVGLASSTVHGVQNAVMGKETGKVLISEQAQQVSALLDDIESLTVENQSLKNEVDKLRLGGSDNEVIALLSAENAKLKAKVKEYEQTYG